MPTERTEEDPVLAENRQLKLENESLKRKLARYEADKRNMTAEQLRERTKFSRGRVLDPKSPSALNRPWDGR